MKLIKILFFSLALIVSAQTQVFAEEIRTSSDLLNSIAAAKDKQVVIVNFYASWCAPCREEIPHLISIRNKYPAEQLKIIAINIDEQKKTMQAFNEKSKINYEAHHDTETKIQQFFNIQSIPFNLVYSKKGKAIYASPGSVREEQLTEIVEYGLNN